VADRITAFWFEDPRIRDVHVRIHKPEILKGKASVGIEMRRHRRSA
jgi:dihydroneopterin aldolase